MTHLLNGLLETVRVAGPSHPPEGPLLRVVDHLKLETITFLGPRPPPLPFPKKKQRKRTNLVGLLLLFLLFQLHLRLLRNESPHVGQELGQPVEKWLDRPWTGTYLL